MARIVFTATVLEGRTIWKGPSTAETGLVDVP